MGDRIGRLKLAAACGAALAAGILAAAVASAQGPGDYQPPTTTTTALPGPGDTRVEFRAKGRAGKLRAHVKVDVYCKERCSASARGRLRLTGIKAQRRAGSESFKLRPASGEVLDGHDVFRLRVPPKGRRVANRAMANGGRARAKVTVIARDAAGNAERERLRLRFRR